MDKFSISKAVGFCLYMFLEHALGKTKLGSMLGLLIEVFKNMKRNKKNE